MCSVVFLWSGKGNIGSRKCHIQNHTVCRYVRFFFLLHKWLKNQIDKWLKKYIHLLTQWWLFTKLMLSRFNHTNVLFIVINVYIEPGTLCLILIKLHRLDRFSWLSFSITLSRSSKQNPVSMWGICWLIPLKLKETYLFLSGKRSLFRHEITSSQISKQHIRTSINTRGVSFIL